MSKYVDGFLLTVKKSAIEDYKKMAMDGGKIWKEFGALQYMETIMEDPTRMEGCAVFADYVKPATDELIVLSFIVFESRAHRDEVNKKVMADPRMSPEMMMNKPMPFDVKKMAYNGFETLVEF
jgi:uncharacterized protein YbaA (DUF1428 family)